MFSPDAVAWEPAATDGHEYQRKVRVMTRGLGGVRLRRRLLDPRVHGFYAYQLVSHKVMRRLMGVPLALLGVSAAARWRSGWLSRSVLGALAGVAAGGAVGAVAPRSRLGRGRICRLSRYFCMVNVAGLVAAADVARGRRVVVWDGPVASGRAQAA